MKHILLLLLSLPAIIACSQEPASNREQAIVFTSVNVIPMDKERVLRNQVVVIKNGKIADIGEAGKIVYGKNALIINGEGKYLMPGLAEMHAHIPPNNDLESMKENLLLFAMHGVTTIRGMLGHPRHIELREMINKDEVIGPKFYTSGPSFNGNSVKTPEQAAEMVRQQKQAGYDFLKLHPGLSRESFDAMATTAKEVNIPFAGHVSYAVGVWHAIDAGYSTIDHLDGFIEGLVPGIETYSEQELGLFGMFIADKAETTRINTLMNALRDNNIWVVPTQALSERWFLSSASVDQLRNAPEMKYMSKAQLDNWSNSKKNLMNNPKYDSTSIQRFNKLRHKIIYECNKNGVGLLLGSDAPQIFNVPGASVHHELKYMVDAGLTPYEALLTGTVNVAKFYKLSAEKGIIKKGAVAELILLNGNPLEDIGQTWNIEGVMLRDKWLSKAFITKTLKSLEKR